MRRLIVSNVMSLDGFFEDADRTLSWFVQNEGFFDYAREMLRAVDTILFGRTTYAMMAAYWPSAPADEMAEKMNHLPKVVFSNTLPSVEWKNSRLVRGDAAEEVRRLKQTAGEDMVILGSSVLASALLQAGLIDEYRVILTPVLLGRGTPLFQGIRGPVSLKLAGVRDLTAGVVLLSYEDARVQG